MKEVSNLFHIHSSSVALHNLSKFNNGICFPVYAPFYFDNVCMLIFQGLQEKVTCACVDMHYSVSLMAEQYLQETKRPYYVVPSLFGEYMGTFTKMLRSRGEELFNIRCRPSCVGNTCDMKVI